MTREELISKGRRSFYHRGPSFSNRQRGTMKLRWVTTLAFRGRVGQTPGRREEG